MLALEVERFYNKKILRRVHQALVFYTIKRRNLAAIGAEVQTRMNLRIDKQVLFQMICKYAKKVDLKQRKKDFISKKKQEAEYQYFYFWAHKFRNLKMRECQISRTHSILVKKNIFTHWLQKSR